MCATYGDQPCFNFSLVCLIMICVLFCSLVDEESDGSCAEEVEASSCVEEVEANLCVDEDDSNLCVDEVEAKFCVDEAKANSCVDEVKASPSSHLMPVPIPGTMCMLC